MPDIKLLIFDIDGTILLTGGAGKIAFERIFEEQYGIPNAWKGTSPDGKTDGLIIEELAQKNLGRSFDTEEHLKFRIKYEQYFEEELPQGTGFRLMPGIPELLERISLREDAVMGLATGNYEKTAWLKVEKAGCRKFFSFGGFGSDSSDRNILTKVALQKGCEMVKQPISQDSVYVIGDTVHDIFAGKHVAAKTIAVATGKTTIDILQEAGPDHLFKDFSDIEAVLKAID